MCVEIMPLCALGKPTTAHTVVWFIHHGYTSEVVNEVVVGTWGRMYR
jgi:hypothetical protein